MTPTHGVDAYGWLGLWHRCTTQNMLQGAQIEHTILQLLVGTLEVSLLACTAHMGTPPMHHVMVGPSYSSLLSEMLTWSLYIAIHSDPRSGTVHLAVGHVVGRFTFLELAHVLLDEIELALGPIQSLEALFPAVPSIFTSDTTSSAAICCAGLCGISPHTIISSSVWARL